MKKLILIATLLFAFSQLKAQNKPNDGLADFPSALVTIMKSDDTIALDKLVTTDNINTCYGNYSLLSQAVRANAKKCFDLLISKGANVNQVCNGYVPPLMHAAKYGRMDMVKVLIAKGADKNYVYDGDIESIKDMSPLTYAEAFKQTAVADYLKSLK